MRIYLQTNFLLLYIDESLHELIVTYFQYASGVFIRNFHRDSLFMDFTKRLLVLHLDIRDCEFIKKKKKKKREKEKKKKEEKGKDTYVLIQ